MNGFPYPLSEETLRAMIADPRYEDPRHPDHEAWHDLVRRGYQALYGTEPVRTHAQAYWNFDQGPAEAGRAANLAGATGPAQARDSEIGHLSPGEIVIPASVQTPEVIEALLRAFGDETRLLAHVVGHPANPRNPVSGYPAFADGDREGWPGLFPGQGPAWHHNRNDNQKNCPPNAPTGPDWKHDGTSALHCGYEDYRGRTGGPNHGHQCVYTKDGQLVTKKSCEGTHDYVSPFGKDGKVSPLRVGGHVAADVIPWLLFGN